MASISSFARTLGQYSSGSKIQVDERSASFPARTSHSAIDSGDWGGLCSLLRGLLRVVLNPLLLPGAVANPNKVGAVLGRFRAPAHCERAVSPACSLDLLPLIDSLNGHLISSLQGYARVYTRCQKCSIL